LLESTVIKRT